MDWHDHISVNPRVCHGKPCIKGTRVMVSVILDNLAAGESEAEIVAAYPGVTPDGIRACLGYAAALVREPIALVVE